MYFNPLAPEESFQPEDDVYRFPELARIQRRALATEQSLYEDVIPEAPRPLDDTDWWQGPLNKVIGRPKADITKKFYPESIEETMTITSEHM